MVDLTARQTVLKGRASKGASLAELVVASILITFIFAVVGEMVVLTTMSTLRLENQVNSTDSARQALRKISFDIKDAKCFGDFYGGALQRNLFPAASNPKYGSSYGANSPEAGWPGYPWTSPPYTLSSTCLIVQQPVFYSGTTSSAYDGYPIMLKKSSIAPGVPPVSMEDLDTVIYQVVPGSLAGTFSIQMVRYANFSRDARQTQGLNSIAEVVQPQSFVKGLVGPKSIGAGETDLPQVFTYYRYDETDSGNLRQLTQTELSNPVLTSSIVGVGVDLEVLQYEGNSSYARRTALRGEYFLGPNRNVVMLNTDE